MKMKMKKIMFGILCAFALIYMSACNTPSNGTATKTTPKPKEKPEVVEEKPAAMLVNFINTDDIDAALKRAQKEKKVLFIDFYTSWCTPCKMMEQGVFRDALVADYMNANCISIRVNAEKGNGPNMKLAYAVDAYPTMLFYTPSGDEVARKEGSLGIEEFKKYMKASVWKAKNPAGTP
jgi:thiol:disulfide interchange protein